MKIKKIALQLMLLPLALHVMSCQESNDVQPKKEIIDDRSAVYVNSDPEFETNDDARVASSYFKTKVNQIVFRFAAGADATGYVNVRLVDATTDAVVSSARFLAANLKRSSSCAAIGIGGYWTLNKMVAAGKRYRLEVTASEKISRTDPDFASKAIQWSYDNTGGYTGGTYAYTIAGRAGIIRGLGTDMRFTVKIEHADGTREDQNWDEQTCWLPVNTTDRDWIGQEFIMPLDFSNEEMEDEARADLGVDATYALRLTDLNNVERISLNAPQNSDVSEVEFFPSIKDVTLSNCGLSDLTPLASLVEITKLSLSENQISDLAPLTNLVKLESLGLSFNTLTTITTLSQFTNLKTLIITNNQITDLQPLASLTNLVTLNLDANKITSLTGLENLKKLELLLLGSNNGAWNLTPLSGLTSLVGLYLNHNRITTVTPLNVLTTLKILNLNSNPLTNVSPLTTLRPTLAEIYLCNTSLTSAQIQQFRTTMVNTFVSTCE